MFTETDQIEELKQLAYSKWCNAWNNAYLMNDAQKRDRNFIFESFVWHHYSYDVKGTRAYHNITHILRCLRHFEKAIKHNDVKVRPSCPEEVRLALWLHDIIYNPQSNRNEFESASLAKLIIIAGGGSRRFSKRIEKMIRLTAHSEKGLGYTTIDEQWLLDLDLSILGEPLEIYQWYSKQIRKEFEHIPLHMYKEGRSKVLEAFKSRENIYEIPYFQELFTKQALQNIDNELLELNS